jgi:GNAT superfamily N-acetyltransferase
MIRKGGHHDLPFLRSMVNHAYNWRVNAFEADVPLARYVENWGRPGDTALIAIDGGHSVGAAWYRLFPASAPGYAFVDERTPELSIAVVPSRRKHGVGKELIEALLARARAEGHSAISLSVEQGSPAVSFYERHGFEHVDESEHALTMRAVL